MRTSSDPEGSIYFENAEKNSESVPTPDFDTERDQHEILAWDLRPGDAVAFHALTVHHANRNATHKNPRKGYALRFTGSEICYRLAPGMNLRPGDAVAFHALTVHHANRNATHKNPRKGYALRFTGSEICYRLAPGMNEYVLNPELNPGDAMDSEQDPVVYDATA